MRPILLLGALTLVVLGLCSAASAALVVYDHFDSAEVDTSLWTVDADSTVSQSGSILTIGNSSGNTVWSSMQSTAQYDASALNTYEFKYIGGNAYANPYFGLIGNGTAGHNIFFRPPATNQWKFGINGVAASDTLPAPVSQHPYDFVRTADTWQLWDGGAWPEYIPTLLYETAPGTVVFDPGEKVSFWMAIRPTPGTLSLGYVAVDEVSQAVPVPVTWTGIGGSTWSTASGLNNWNDSNNTAADYVDTAPVTFDDSATGTSVDISTADVAPSSVLFNNTANNFVVTGTNGIAGTTGVVKQGTGTVTLNNVNTYTGVTTVQAGALIMSESSYSNVATNGGADIQGGKGVLDYSVSSISPAPEIQVALAASYNGGAWDIGQIRNTTAAATGLTLGWNDDTAASQVIIMATYSGDADLSGTTDVADLTKLLNNYNKTGMAWATGDFNYDGEVNVADLTALLNNYNKAVGGIVVAGSGPTGSAAPEPGSLALLAGSLLGLLAYAWRKRQ